MAAILTAVQGLGKLMTLESRPMPGASPLPLEDLRLAIASDAAPERNGVGAYYEDLIGYLSPRVASITLFSPTIEDGVWHAGMVFPMPGDETQRLCVPNVYSMRRDLADLQPHVMIVPTPGVYGMTGAFLASRRGIPVITGFHTSFEQLADLYWHGSLTGRVFLQYIDKTHRYLIRKSAAAMVNSSEMEEEVRRCGANTVVRIGTPISRLFTTQPLTPYQGDFRQVLFAGRLAAEKNIAAILASARQLPHLIFNIAGDGPYRPEVEQGARELANVNYLGWLSREGLLERIDASDCLILPSHFESFGTIALEAMSRQRVVVVSKAAGITDWPPLVPGLEIIGDAGLSASLEKLAAMDVSSRTALAQRGYEAAQAFNDANLQGWEKLLLDVANR